MLVLSFCAGGCLDCCVVVLCVLVGVFAMLLVCIAGVVICVGGLFDKEIRLRVRVLIKAIGA